VAPKRHVRRVIVGHWRPGVSLTQTEFPTRSRRRATLRIALLVSDMLMLLAATQLASLVRFGQLRHVAAFPELGPSATFLRVSLVIVALGLGALWFERLYDLDRVFWGTGEYSRVVKALAMGIVALILVEYAAKLPGLSRGWTLLALFFGIAFVCVGRAAVRYGLVLARRRGKMLRPTLVVGFNQEAEAIIQALGRNTSSGLVPVGCLASSRSDQLALNHCGDVPCVGYAGEIRDVLDREFYDTVLIVSTAFDHDILSRIIADLRGRDVDIQLSSGLLDVTTSRVLIREVSGVPLITIRGVAFTPMRRFVKRTFDLVLGGLIVLVGMPLWLLVMLAIKLDSPGPVFYRQQRIGHGGQPFGMLKFRSMRADAEAVRAELAEENQATGPLFKIRDDPRVTRVGRWMRRLSIDEFPQLINVLAGEMSLVGPRPPLPGETHEYSDYHWRRMEVLPGMTGLWQVSGRSSLTFDEMIRLDLLYIENWSVGFDLGLMLRTVPAVLSARGAY
jgi:exopolysaccharide biosynthesis polyprenyl glycosylphosphotransferase